MEPELYVMEVRPSSKSFDERKQNKQNQKGVDDLSNLVMANKGSFLS